MTTQKALALLALVLVLVGFFVPGPFLAIAVMLLTLIHLI
jgi:hypothetical protein